MYEYTLLAGDSSSGSARPSLARRQFGVMAHGL